MFKTGCYKIISTYFFLIFFSSHFAFSLSKIKDLNKEIGHSNDSIFIKIKTLNDLAWHLSETNPAKALTLGYKTLEMSSEISYNSGMADSYNCIGAIYEIMGNYSASIENYFSSLRIYEVLSHRQGIAVAYNNIGLVYMKQNQFQLAYEYFLKAAEVDTESNNERGFSATNNNIGLVLKNMGKYEEALDHFSRCIEIDLKNKDSAGISTSYNNIGLIHHLLWKKNGNKEHLNKSLINYFKSLDIKESEGSLESLVISHIAIGELYNDMDLAPKAMEYFLKALTISKRINSKEYLAQTYRGIAKTNYLQKDFRNAFYYQELFSEINKELSNEQISREIAEMKIKYETEKKQKEIEIHKLTINKKDRMILGLSAGIVLLLLIAWLYFSRMKILGNLHSLSIEQKLLRSQMNHHFIFNSLMAIQSFVVENKNEDAGFYINKFAELLRLILKNSRSDFVSLEKEIKTIENYMLLQKLRFEEKFDYFLEVDPSINQKLLSVPPMLAQPFIENSIEHGIVPKNKKGNIFIRFKLDENVLIFEVLDDGIGITKNKENPNHDKHLSLATTITKERLSNLKKAHKQKISWEIINLQDQDEFAEGTKVVFNIPFIMNRENFEQ